MTNMSVKSTTEDFEPSVAVVEEINLKDFVDSSSDLDSRVQQFNEIAELYGTSYKKLYRRPAMAPMANQTVLAVDDGSQREVVMFGSNNYQSLADHPQVIRAMQEAASKYGVGGGGSPLLCGTSVMHTQLEENLASFKGKDECIIFSSGYQAQQGWMKALLDKNDIVFLDSYSHASFNEGLLVTGVKKVPFKHNNLDDLERKIRAFRDRRKTAWIFVEGVYSMHGDAVDLKKVVELSKKYNCKIAVDDAHGLGVLGKTGRGIEEHCGVDPKDIAISIGTFSKSLGAIGGYVCTSEFYGSYIRYMAKSYMFSSSMSSPVVAAVNESINILRNEPQRGQILMDKVNYLVEGLNRIGIQTSSESAIVAIPIPETADTRALAIAYDQENIFINLVDYPAVPLSQQRFRATVIYSHTHEDLDKLINATQKIFTQHGLL